MDMDGMDGMEDCMILLSCFPCIVVACCYLMCCGIVMMMMGGMNRRNRRPGHYPRKEPGLEGSNKTKIHGSNDNTTDAQLSDNKSIDKLFNSRLGDTISYARLRENDVLNQSPTAITDHINDPSSFADKFKDIITTLQYYTDSNDSKTSSDLGSKKVGEVGSMIDTNTKLFDSVDRDHSDYVTTDRLSLVDFVHESVESVKATMRSESLLPEYRHHGGVSSWKVGGASTELYGPEGSFTLVNSTTAVSHITEVFLGNVSVAL